MVGRNLSTLGHEARRMLPPRLYFPVCLDALVLTVALLSDEQGTKISRIGE